MDYDLAVVGGGPAGYVGALKGAQLGAKVLLIEKERVGGTCLNWGCIPTKTLLFNAKLYRYLGRLEGLGLSADNVSFDFTLIQKRKSAVVDKFVRGVEYLLKKRQVEIVRGEARIDKKKRLWVTTDESEVSFQANRILVATGSSPARLRFPGVEYTMDSSDALSLGAPPDSLVVVGGGAVGVEFAIIFASFGTKVTIVELMESILPGEDGEITRLLSRSLQKQGIDVHTSSTLTRIDRETGTLRSVIRSSSGEWELASEKVLLSVGRTPNVGVCEELALAADRGFIHVDGRMQTSLPGIYAAGDVCGKFLLAYTASKEAEVAVCNALGVSAEMEYEAVPRLIYSHPEVGAVGLTEEQARSAHEIVVGRFPMMGNARAYAETEAEGMVKVIAEKQNEKILGIHILGPYATELVLAATVMLQKEMSLQDAADIIYGHPTFSETIRESLLDAAGIPLHK
jgi:dihydrolipoamide dehydrogenase